MGELTKFIDEQVQYCTNNNFKKEETRQHMFNFLKNNNINYTLLDNSNDKFQIDEYGWEICYNSKGICRGHKGFYFGE